MFNKILADLNQDAWAPDVLRYDGWRGRMDDNKEIHVGVGGLEWTIHWSGWIIQHDSDALQSYWAAYSRPTGQERTVVAPCFSSVVEIKEGERFDFDGAFSTDGSCGLHYHMARLDEKRFTELADYEKRASLSRLLRHLGAPEKEKAPPEIVRLFENLKTIPVKAGEPVFAGVDRADGEVICPQCKTNLNHTDRNCWRCGFVLGIDG